MRWYKRISLQRRILLSFILFLVILSVVFGLFIARTARNGQDYYGGVLRQANSLIDDKLTTIIEDLRYTSAMYLVNTDILTYVENDFYMGKSQYVEVLRELKTNTLAVKVNPNLSSVTYLTLSGQVYSGAGYNEQYLQNLGRVAAEMEEKGVKYIITPVYETTINQQRMTTVTYAFRMSSPYNFKTVGYGFINIDMKRLAQSFQVLTIGETTAAMAVQDGRPVLDLSDSESEVGQAIADAVTGRQEQTMAGDALFTVKAGGESYLCAAAWNQAMGLNIVNYAPMEIVNAQAFSGLMLYVISIVLLLVVFAGVSVILSIVMTKPIRILQSGMKAVEEGGLKPITEQADRQDDMGELIRGFNHMVSELKDSILREYESRDLQRKAQIKMLESQINPHFLYNVLNLISSIALLEDVPQISDIATDLAGLFRYSVSGGSTVTLREELAQVRRYIAIQRLCMAGELKVEYQTDDTAEECQVLKFLLQPLVENCFIHGFGRRGSGGALTIAARLEGGELLITVRDDGAGIPPERLDELQRLCREPQVLYEKGHDGIGMLNVNFRLMAFYGKEHGLNIQSRPGGGTTLSMQIPVSLEKEGA